MNLLTLFGSLFIIGTLARRPETLLEYDNAYNCGVEVLQVCGYTLSDSICDRKNGTTDTCMDITACCYDACGGRQSKAIVGCWPWGGRDARAATFSGCRCVEGYRKDKETANECVRAVHVSAYCNEIELDHQLE